MSHSVSLPQLITKSSDRGTVNSGRAMHRGSSDYRLLAASVDPLPWYHLLPNSLGLLLRPHPLGLLFWLPVLSLTCKRVSFSPGLHLGFFWWSIWPVLVTVPWSLLASTLGVSCGFPAVRCASLLASPEAVSMLSFLCAAQVGTTAPLDSGSLASHSPWGVQGLWSRLRGSSLFVHLLLLLSLLFLASHHHPSGPLQQLFMTELAPFLGAVTQL